MAIKNFKSKDVLTSQRMNEIVTEVNTAATEITNIKGSMATKTELSGATTGKFYGFFASDSGLPTGDALDNGYAYVGASSPYQIWNKIDNAAWANSGSTIANPALEVTQDSSNFLTVAVDGVADEHKFASKENIDSLETKLGDIEDGETASGKLSELEKEIGSDTKEIALTPDDAIDLYWNGAEFIKQSGDGVNDVVLKCYKGVTYTPVGNRLSFYVFKDYPKKGATEKPIKYFNSIINPYLSEYDGYMVFQFSDKASISVHIEQSGFGIFNDISEIRNTLQTKADTSALESNVATLTNSINAKADMETVDSLALKVGDNAKEIHYTSDDAAGMYWGTGGTEFIRQTGDGTNGFKVRYIKGVTYTPLNGVRVSAYILNGEPKVGAKPKQLGYISAKNTPWVADVDGWLFFQFATKDECILNISMSEYGIKKDVNRIDTLDDRIDTLDDRIDTLGGNVSELEEEVGSSDKEYHLTGDDAIGLFWNGNTFVKQTGDAHNIVVIKCYKDVTYMPLNAVRISFYLFSKYPTLGSTEQPLTYKSAINQPWIAESNGWMVFQFSTKSDISVNIGVSGYGIITDINTIKEQVSQKVDLVEVAKKADITYVDKVVGVEKSEIHKTPEDTDNMYWGSGGTEFIRQTGEGFNGFKLKYVKGVTYTPLNGVRVSAYVLDGEPQVGAKLKQLGYINSVNTPWVADVDGWLFFQFATKSACVLDIGVRGYGIVNDISVLRERVSNIEYNEQLKELSIGTKFYRQKSSFTWKSFEKPIITLRCDDLNADVDLVASIVIEAGLPIVLAAPADNLNASVSGIIDASKKIANTRGEVCQYVVNHGGEILEHSYVTFDSTDYSIIKQFFIDSKAEFMKLGINVRGAGVANSTPNPSDAHGLAILRALAPYLYYYYEYSNGYGEKLPYSFNWDRQHPNFDGINESAIKTLEQFIPELDSCIRNKRHLTFIIHSLSSSAVTETEYRKIVQYVKTK